MPSPSILSPAGAKKLAEQIREIGKHAHSEEDVRLNVEHALRPVLEKLGITTQAAYEQPLTLLQGPGRADAVYGFGIFEYERPGWLAVAKN